MCSGLFKRLSDCLLKDQPFVMQNFVHFNQYEIVLTFSLIIVSATRFYLLVRKIEN